MTWGIWQFQSSVRLRIILGYVPGSLVHCINLLIKYRVHLQELRIDGEGSSSTVGPIVMEVTLRNPGKRKIRAIIAALNRSTLGCREETS